MRRSKTARLFLRILHHHHHIIIIIFNSLQTTQATELTQTRTQIAPPTLTNQGRHTTRYNSSF